MFCFIKLFHRKIDKRISFNFRFSNINDVKDRDNYFNTTIDLLNFKKSFQIN